MYGFWAHDNSEVTQEELGEHYDELLDSCGDITIGELTLSASDIVRSCDPVAYRVGVSDYHSELIEEGIILEELESDED